WTPARPPAAREPPTAPAPAGPGDLPFRHPSSAAPGAVPATLTGRVAKTRSPARAGLRVSPVATAGLLAGDHAHHFQALVGIAPLVVVPGHQLDEGGIQRDARVGVEHGGAGLANEVGGDDLVLGVAEDALERALALRLHL